MPSSSTPAAQVVASWQRDAVHVWGWDGVQTMPPAWLLNGSRRAGGAGSPSPYGFHSSLDVTAPNGERLRPVSVRLDAVSGTDWLRRVTAGSDAVRWFGAVATLAGRVVDAGAVVPTLSVAGCRRRRPPRHAGLRSPVSAVTDALDSLAEAMPAICLPDALDALAGATAAAVSHDLRTLRRRHGARAAAARRLGARRRAGPHRRRRRPPATCSAPSPVRTPACRRRARCRSTCSAGSPSTSAASPCGRAAIPSSCAACASSCPTTSGIRGSSPSSSSTRTTPDGGAALPTCGRATPSPSRSPADRRTWPLLEAMVLRARRDRRWKRRRAGAARTRSPSPPRSSSTSTPPRSSSTRHRRRSSGSASSSSGPSTSCAPTSPCAGAPHPARPATARPDSTARRSCGGTTPPPTPTGRRRSPPPSWPAPRRAGSSLLHIGHRWVRIDPAALRRVRTRHDAYLRRIEELEAPATKRRHRPVGPRAPRRRGGGGGRRLRPSMPTSGRAWDVSAAWSGLLLGGLPDTDAGRGEPNRRRSAASCGPYQRRGLSWLRFLDRLGLGGCLADDMGLGKTATTLAHLVDRHGPHLVVCPLSVVHNWETEARRFTPSLDVVVHHGAQRHAANDGGSDGSESAAALLGCRPRRHHVRPRHPRPRCPRRRRLVDGRARRSAVRQEPGHPGGSRRAQAAGAATHRPHRHTGGEPAVRAVGDPRLGQPRHARLARALPPPLLQAHRAWRRRSRWPRRQPLR